MTITPERTAKLLTGLLGGAGVLHFINPEPFASIVPDWVPGTKKQIAYLSGVAELTVAGLLATPATRRVGGAAAAALFAAVFPGNIEMARQWKDRPVVPWQLISLGRLPLQIPLIAGGVQVARAER